MAFATGTPMIVLLAALVLGSITPEPSSGVALSRCDVHTTRADYSYEVRAHVTDQRIRAIDIKTLNGDGYSQSNLAMDLEVHQPDERWVKRVHFSFEPPNYNPLNIKKVWCEVGATLDVDGKVIWRNPRAGQPINLYDPATLGP